MKRPDDATTGIGEWHCSRVNVNKSAAAGEPGEPLIIARRPRPVDGQQRLSNNPEAKWQNQVLIIEAIAVQSEHRSASSAKIGVVAWPKPRGMASAKSAESKMAIRKN